MISSLDFLKSAAKVHTFLELTNIFQEKMTFSIKKVLKGLACRPESPPFQLSAPKAGGRRSWRLKNNAYFATFMPQKRLTPYFYRQ